MADELHQAIDEETAIQLAVRDRLRVRLGIDPKFCAGDIDEIVPATIGDFYILVLNAGIRKGDTHDPSGGTWDLLYSVKIVVIQKVTQLPRDRLGEILETNHTFTQFNINRRIRDVMTAIDSNYDTINRANVMLFETGDPDITQSGSSWLNGFNETLKLSAIDDRPQRAESSLFAGVAGRSANDIIGLKRSATFSGARRMKTRTQIDSQ